jgi:hypothetical protein
MTTENVPGSVQRVTGMGRLGVGAGRISFPEIPVALPQPVEPEAGPFRINGTVCIHLLQKKTARRPYRKMFLIEPTPYRSD